MVSIKAHCNEVLKTLPELTETESRFLTAAYDGDFSTIKTLINEGVNINIRGNHNGMTAFYLAVSEGHYTIMDFLLKQDNINVNTPSAIGCTPIIRAVREESEYAIEQLTKRNDADYTAKEPGYLTTVFSWADEMGNNNISKQISKTTGVPLGQDNSFVPKPIKFI